MLLTKRYPWDIDYTYLWSFSLIHDQCPLSHSSTLMLPIEKVPQLSRKTMAMISVQDVVPTILHYYEVIYVERGAWVVHCGIITRLPFSYCLWKRRHSFVALTDPGQGTKPLFYASLVNLSHPDVVLALTIQRNLRKSMGVVKYFCDIESGIEKSSVIFLRG